MRISQGVWKVLVAIALPVVVTAIADAAIVRCTVISPPIY